MEKETLECQDSLSELRDAYIAHTLIVPTQREEYVVEGVKIFEKMITKMYNMGLQHEECGETFKILKCHIENEIAKERLQKR